MDRVLNWPSLHDPRLHPYIRDVATAARFICHTTAAKDPKLHRSEYFIHGNRGKTLHDDLSAAGELGLGVHLCLDPHHGNGRDEDGGSPTLKGKYHINSEGKYWIHEGGVVDAIRGVFDWIGDYAHIRTFQLFNEPKDAEWLVEHARNHKWFEIARAECDAAGVDFVGVYGDAGWTELSAEHCHAIDVHSLFDEPAVVADRLRGARRAGLPVYVMEWVSRERKEAEMDLVNLADEGLAGIGGFLGDLEHDFSRWNFRPQREFVCHDKGGITLTGRAWQSVFGSGEVEPPEPVPPVPEPPEPTPPPAEPQTVRGLVDKIRRQSERRQGKPWGDKAAGNVAGWCDEIDGLLG